MAKARKASVTQSKLGMILYGEPFTGKSTMAMQLAYFKRPDGKPFRVLYLDPETGSIDDYLGDLEENGVNLENIYIVYTQSLGEVRQYIAKVKNGEDFYELDDDGEETDEVVLDADGEPLEGVNKIAKTIENKGFSRKGKADGKNFVRWKPLHILERCKEKRQGKTAVRHGLGIVFKL